MKKTAFELKQIGRLTYLKKEKEIVERGRINSVGSPILAIHDMRIEEQERFLGIRK